MEVPITPSVLKWAIEESGYTLPEVSAGIDGGERAVTAWLSGDAKPSLTELRRIARRLHRQLATFLLPTRPKASAMSVRFRHPLGGHERALNAVERRYVRRALRLQDAHAWLLRELGHEKPQIPDESVVGNPSAAAARCRSRLGVPVSEQANWRSASVAFDAWREAVERQGVIVVLFPMGGESCRGFSLWNDVAPLVAVNTAWRDEARIFTLFHELGHLLTRTSSVCEISAASTGDAQEPAERWCETFAASVVIPADVLQACPSVSDIKGLSRLANQYKVSLRAMAIRLIGAGKATWALYRTIPGGADNKREGGGGGTGRNRREIREDEFGHRGTSVFVEAVQREVITESQALDYLDIPVSEFDRLGLPVAS